VQRHFRRTYGEDPPTDKTIVRWHNQFKETGNVNLKKMFRPTDHIERECGVFETVMSAQPQKVHRHLKERSNAAITTVTPDMIQRTWSEIDYCPDICRATGGAHIETF
jgi:hypothetical protein